MQRVIIKQGMNRRKWETLEKPKEKVYLEFDSRPKALNNKLPDNTEDTMNLFCCEYANARANSARL